MKTLLIYLILNNSCQWEFFALEHVDTNEYCEFLSEQVHESNVRNGLKIGNMEIVCSVDHGFEI